jgi:hypothetical protein
VLLDNVELSHEQTVDLEMIDAQGANPRLSYFQSTDDHPADCERADGECTKRDSADGQRAHAPGAGLKLTELRVSPMRNCR